MAAQYQFVMRSGPTVGKTYPLDAQEITIGRDAVNIIAINDAEVSRRHARMELRGSAYVIQDLGSTNGTFVNGTRISGMQVLNPGDTVSFGEGIVLVYEPVADVNATILSTKAPQVTVQKPAPTPPHPCPAPTPAPVTRAHARSRAGLLRPGAGWPGADAAGSCSGKEKIPGVGHYHRDRDRGNRLVS